jgi:hypothetical protein
MTRLASNPEVFPACDKARHVFHAAMRSVPKALSDTWHITWKWDAVSRKATSPLLLVFEAQKVDDSHWLSLLHDVGHYRHKAFLMLAGSIPCQGIAERLAKLNIRDPERIHVARVQPGDEEKLFVERLLLTLGSDQQQERILDAWWEDHTFVVTNPRFRKLHIPLGKIRCLAGKPREQLENFRIDEDGVFVHWPDLDIHLGWEQFAQAVDNADYLKARQASAAFNRQYGQAIRGLREKQGLRQSDIEGLTPRQVGRIARGQCRATHSALATLAGSHRLPLSDYLASLADMTKQGKVGHRP